LNPARRFYTARVNFGRPAFLNESPLTLEKRPLDWTSQAAFLRDHRPVPAALCARQSGDTSTRLEPHTEQTKRQDNRLEAHGRRPQADRIAARHPCAGDALRLEIGDEGRD
jgi:hypothetical protein